MDIIKHKDKKYLVDSEGFLADHRDWDDDFPEAVAKDCGIEGGITDDHRRVIGFIRDHFETTGQCPLVYETCRANGLFLAGLKELFPSGYLRGACRMAGLTYREGYVKYSWVRAREKRDKADADKVYRCDVRGFLVDPAEWDEEWAINRAHDLKMPAGLNGGHWNVINRARKFFEENGRVPTIFETCEANSIDIEHLEALFPDGYHRGAIRLAGLKKR